MWCVKGKEKELKSDSQLRVGRDEQAKTGWSFARPMVDRDPKGAASGSDRSDSAGMTGGKAAPTAGLTLRYSDLEKTSGRQRQSFDCPVNCKPLAIKADFNPQEQHPVTHLFRQGRPTEECSVEQRVESIHLSTHLPPLALSIAPTRWSLASSSGPASVCEQPPILAPSAQFLEGLLRINQ